MPISPAFSGRLVPQLEDLAERFGTPFHIYDAAGIRDTCREFARAFAGIRYRQYFAVKALPNPWILDLLRQEGSGFDCASVPELELADWVGARGEDIFFTSNNTTAEEFAAAEALGAIVNLDDPSFVADFDRFPELACFRLVIPELGRACDMMGRADHSKFGAPFEKLLPAYRAARERGARRFGLHAMLCSNELDAGEAINASTAVIARAAALAAELGERFDFVNLGGGIGIPYPPEQQAFDLPRFAAGVTAALHHHFPDSAQRPAIYTECGRSITGPHGVLVTRVVNRMQKTKAYAGVDASMSALMRPALYGAYHHVSLPLAEGREEVQVDVIGSLCENNDKFAIDRTLPDPRRGDLLLVHDTGAHGISMGFTYNGRLRPKELLLNEDGSVTEVRRAETSRDYFATVTGYPPRAAAERPGAAARSRAPAELQTV